MGNNKFSITRPLVVTLLANFMGAFQFGFNIGAPSNTQDIVEKFMNRTLYEREGSIPSETRLTDLWAIIVAIYFLCAGVGALCFKWMSQLMGRKRGMLYNIFLGIVAAALLFSSRRSEKWEILLVGRALVGFHVGLYSGLVPMYLSEVSPKIVRGAISSLMPVGLTSAIFVSQILGFPSLLGTNDLWDVLFGLSVLPCLLQLMLLPFCVESPRYLMVCLKDKEAAKHAYQTLRQSDDVDDEIQDLQEEMNKSAKPVSLYELFKYPPYRRATIIATLSLVTLQLCGLNGVIFFSNQLFQEAMNISQSDAAYLTCSIGFIQILMALIATPLTDKAGRRMLQLIGLVGLIFSTALTTVFLALRDEVEGFDVISIIFLLLFLVFFGIGPGQIPWILTGELFTQNARPVASSFAVTGHWLCGFAVAYMFPPMRRDLKDYVFLPFCGFIALATVYTYFNLPETKGKTIQEVTASFEKPGDPLQKPDAYRMSDKENGDKMRDTDSVQSSSNETLSCKPIMNA